MSKIFPVSGLACRSRLVCLHGLVHTGVPVRTGALLARGLLFFWLLAAILIPSAPSAQTASLQPAPAPLRVVTSIKPLHALVAGVMQGVATPDLLIAGSSSPHQFSLKPSMAAMLERADIVFWIGPELELFLVDPLKNLAPDALRIPLASLVALPAQEDGPGASLDPHIWLDPDIGASMVKLIAERLAEADPDNAGAYALNAANYQQELTRLTLGIEAQLAPLRDIPFVTFHEAYTHFNRRFGLNSLGAITLSPEQRPGVRRLREIQALIRDENVRCVFAEPQFDESLVSLVIEGTGARSAVLDPLGFDLQPGPELYFELEENIARSIRECLAP